MNPFALGASGEDSRPGLDAGKLREEFLKDPAFVRRWRQNKPRRRLSMVLISMRKNANLSQRRLGEDLGWNQSQIARMESATGPWPSPKSLRAFASACGVSVGLVFTHPEGESVHIDNAISFGDTEGDLLLEQIARRDVGVQLRD